MIWEPMAIIKGRLCKLEIDWDKNFTLSILLNCLLNNIFMISKRLEKTKSINWKIQETAKKQKLVKNFAKIRNTISSLLGLFLIKNPACSKVLKVFLRNEKPPFFQH